MYGRSVDWAFMPSWLAKGLSRRIILLHKSNYSAANRVLRRKDQENDRTYACHHAAEPQLHRPQAADRWSDPRGQPAPASLSRQLYELGAGAPPRVTKWTHDRAGSDADLDGGAARNLP